jgi:hypothetical protein
MGLRRYWSLGRLKFEGATGYRPAPKMTVLISLRGCPALFLRKSTVHGRESLFSFPGMFTATSVPDLCGRAVIPYELIDPIYELFERHRRAIAEVAIRSGRCAATATLTLVSQMI